MTNQRYLRLGLLLSLLIIGLVALGFTSFALVRAAGQPKTLDRDLEPLVLKGSQVSGLIGTPVNQLFVYATSNSNNPALIPVQVDEINGSGVYVAVEDGLLDNNDEIVFMAKDSGSKADDPTTVLNSEPIGVIWYEIEITDPLDPAKQGWVYLVSSNTGTLAQPNTDYAFYVISDSIRIVGTEANITTDSRYEIGFASQTYGDHPGLDYLFLNSKPNQPKVDLLDRTKLRVRQGFLDLTESFFGNITPTLIVDGNVRVILTQQGSVPGLATLANLYKGYFSMVDLTASVSSNSTPSEARISMDFSRAISGATFYNANALGGVIINGSPDPTIAMTPVSRWFQVSHARGRFIQVTNPVPAGGEQGNFYQDDKNADDSPDSPFGGIAQDGSFGNSGFVFSNTTISKINKSFTLRTQFFTLSASSTNVGAIYESYYLNPLQVCFRENALGDCLQNAPSENVFLPVVLK